MLATNAALGARSPVEKQGLKRYVTANTGAQTAEEWEEQPTAVAERPWPRHLALSAEKVRGLRLTFSAAGVLSATPLRAG
jgi:hypothetical protein